ncbi:MAG: hypothetical protein ACKVWR_21915 [Acidimicrobiales bacterium]
MAITTQDGLLAAMGGSQKLQWNKANVTAVAGRACSVWSGTGRPGVGSTTLGQAAAGVVPVDSDTGFHSFTNPSGGQLSYLGGASGISAASGLIIIYDVLWVWGSGGSGWVVTTTTAQNTTSPAALTRPDANGAATEAWLEILATMGAGAATPVLSYTDQSGNSGNTTSSPMITSYAASSIIGSCYSFPLAAPDTGLRTVQSLTLSVSMTSGTARVMICRRVAEIPCTANQGFKYDAYDLGLPRVYDDAALMPIFVPNSTASGPLILSLDLVQG